MCIPHVAVHGKYSYYLLHLQEQKEQKNQRWKDDCDTRCFYFTTRIGVLLLVLYVVWIVYTIFTFDWSYMPVIKGE